MEAVAPLLLAVAVSVDSLAVGVTYGLRQIRFAPWALVIVGTCTLLLMAVAVVLGRTASGVLPAQVSEVIGAAILIGMGGWQLQRGLRDRRTFSRVPAPGLPGAADGVASGEVHARRLLTSFRIPLVGIVVQVLEDPVRADRDASQRIEAKEALVLGIALGLDAFGAGVGAALAGFSLWIVPLVAAGAAFFLVLGSRLGGHALRKLQGLGPSLAFLPALVLMGTGLYNLLRSVTGS